MPIIIDTTPDMPDWFFLPLNYQWPNMDIENSTSFSTDSWYPGHVLETNATGLVTVSVTSWSKGVPGDVLIFVQGDAGAIRFSSGSGTSVLAHCSGTPTTAGPGAVAYLRYLGSGAWLAYGDLVQATPTPTPLSLTDGPGFITPGADAGSTNTPGAGSAYYVPLTVPVSAILTNARLKVSGAFAAKAALYDLAGNQLAATASLGYTATQWSDFPFAAAAAVPGASYILGMASSSNSAPFAVAQASGRGFAINHGTYAAALPSTITPSPTANLTNPPIASVW